MLLNPAIFVELGNSIMQRHAKTRSAKTEERRFRGHFGTSPEICSILWDMVDPGRTMPKGARPKHLLWSLAFLKLYLNEEALSGLAGGVDEKTLRKWTWIFVYAMSDLEAIVVRSTVACTDVRNADNSLFAF
jgi:DDE superfamily endonuclease